jgi:protein SCO1/2
MKRLVWFTVLLVMALSLSVLFFTRLSAPKFRLTALEPPRESFHFTLHDQFGKRISLADFRGKVVVLTFLYTYCPDICPLVTQKFHETHKLLAEGASRVAFLVVTVDPDRDTVKRLYDYSKQFDMLDKWRFLTGSEKDLKPIWDYYWVGKVWKDEKGDVMHEAPLHLIDQQGKVRVASGQTFRPAELAHDIEVLLNRHPKTALR